MQEFKIGDVVKVKGIGPKMNVCEVDGEKIHCMNWIESQNEFGRMWFYPQQLEKLPHPDLFEREENYKTITVGSKKKDDRPAGFIS